MNSSSVLLKSVLIIEDEPSISTMMAEMLIDEGYGVSCAFNGLQALSLLNSTPFDLITLDLGLPELDGNGFLARLSQCNSRVPVVVVSATPRKLVPHPQVKAVIPKPFDIIHLLHTVSQYI